MWATQNGNERGTFAEELVQGIKPHEKSERDGGFEAETVNQPLRRLPINQRVVDGVCPVDGTSLRGQLFDFKAGFFGEQTYGAPIEQIPLAREIITAPIAPFEQAKIQRIRIIGDDDKSSA